MPKRGELFKAAILENDSTQALYITCLYVIKEQFAYLEDEWINMSSHIGKKDGMSFMLITHDLAVLSEIADKIGIMYGGQMVEFGSSQEIYKNPKHPYTQGLLESIPTLKGGTPKYISGTPPSLLDAPTECRFIARCPLAIEKCKKLP